MKKEFEILKDNPKLKIKVTRDSVCAGDDADAPHEKSVLMPSFTDPHVFISHLSSGYLPIIAGTKHTWDCFLNDKCVGVLSNNGLKATVNEVEYYERNHVHFIYHSATS